MNVVIVVQPPPRYVHRNMCTLEWCPGDAREVARNKQRRGSKSAVALGREEVPAVTKVVRRDGAASARPGSATAPVEEWFLKGFEEGG
jgi:hypothetical protein